jgi:hypothetical protein
VQTGSSIIQAMTITTGNIWKLGKRGLLAEVWKQMELCSSGVSLLLSL